MWGILLLLYLVIVLILLIACINLFSNKDLIYTKSMIDIASLKTGDILVTTGAWGVAALTNSVWSHTGVFWRDPFTGSGYVMEMATFDKYKGASKIPIEDWCRYYRKRAVSVTQLITSNGEEYNAVLLESIFNQYSHVNTQFSWKGLCGKPSLLRFLSPGEYKGQINDSYTCYELNISMLQRAGIYKKIYDASAYYPWMLISGSIPTEEGYSYAPMVNLDMVSAYSSMKIETVKKIR